jgi:hypothetical protein
MLPPNLDGTQPEQPGVAGSQPNELDLRRIIRMLRKRARYRYVSVKVIAAAGGYVILSPCCSRTIDNAGGIIEIARIEYDEHFSLWKLFSKDHVRSEWCMRHSGQRLRQVMEKLNQDPERFFWQ